MDVRVIGAPNRSLARLVKEGTLREDLFYRLNVIKIDSPPLRQRAEDIPLLAAQFAEKYAPPGQLAKQIAPEAMQVLLRYEWPGNIRELENAIERASVITRRRRHSRGEPACRSDHCPRTHGVPWHRYEPSLE